MNKTAGDLSNQRPHAEGPGVVRATAPGKAILVGEHAVVYGRPAIAVPIWQTVATASVELLDATATANVPTLTLVAQDIQRVFALSNLASPGEQAEGEEEPLLLVARRTLTELGLEVPPRWRVTLYSQIPPASGLGSGAALCAALVQALWRAAAVQKPSTPPLDPARVSAIVFAAEEIYHGTPSGIDNTVVAYGRPVWFVKGTPPQLLANRAPFRLLVADSGQPGSTRVTVAHVRRLWTADPVRFEAIFDAIAGLVTEARAALEGGVPQTLGPLFNANHAHLQALEVSTPVLDRLVRVAVAAGALGAKLSGGGGGGNVIALVEEESADEVARALRAAGARRVISTQVPRA